MEPQRWVTGGHSQVLHLPGKTRKKIQLLQHCSLRKLESDIYFWMYRDKTEQLFHDHSYCIQHFHFPSHFSRAEATDWRVIYPEHCCPWCFCKLHPTARVQEQSWQAEERNFLRALILDSHTSSIILAPWDSTVCFSPRPLAHVVSDVINMLVIPEMATSNTFMELREP